MNSISGMLGSRKTQHGTRSKYYLSLNEKNWGAHRKMPKDDVDGQRHNLFDFSGRHDLI